MGFPIITKIESRKQFQQHLENNPGVFIVKFGAPWCAPCKSNRRKSSKILFFNA